MGKVQYTVYSMVVILSPRYCKIQNNFFPTKKNISTVGKHLKVFIQYCINRSIFPLFYHSEYFKTQNFYYVFLTNISMIKKGY